eukprot:7280_1
MYTGEYMLASRAGSDYNEMAQFGAIGKLDVEALKMALAFLWRRHQVLRTGLILQEAKAEENSLIQIIRPPEESGGTIPLEIWDCTNGWNSSGFDSTADALAAIGGHVA